MAHTLWMVSCQGTNNVKIPSCDAGCTPASGDAESLCVEAMSSVSSEWNWSKANLHHHGYKGFFMMSYCQHFAPCYTRVTESLWRTTWGKPGTVYHTSRTLHKYQRLSGNVITMCHLWRMTSCNISVLPILVDFQSRS